MRDESELGRKREKGAREKGEGKRGEGRGGQEMGARGEETGGWRERER